MLQKMMLPVVVVLTCIPLFLQPNVASAAIVADGVFDENGNYITNHRHPEDARCCIVPTCDEYNECFGSLHCGYVCSQGTYKFVNYGSTPGFSLKESYSKIDCHFGVCQNYKFLCKHCPDPREDDFNIFTVRKGCRDCYYKKE